MSKISLTARKYIFEVVDKYGLKPDCAATKNYGMLTKAVIQLLAI